MRGFSKAVLAGNLTRDPEVRSIPSGASVCSFAVAVNRTYRGTDGQTKEDTSFIDCVAWGKPGEIIAQYCKKGSGIIVTGRLSQRSFEGKDGTRRSRTEVVVEDFVFVGGGSRQDSSGSNYGGNSDGFDPTTAFGAPVPSLTNAPAQNAGAPNMPDFPNDIPEDIPEGEIDVSAIPF